MLFTQFCSLIIAFSTIKGRINISLIQTSSRRLEAKSFGPRNSQLVLNKCRPYLHTCHLWPHRAIGNIFNYIRPPASGSVLWAGLKWN